jgi:pimeloyl-ACP methyl ester carboxylesterase
MTGNEHSRRDHVGLGVLAIACAVGLSGRPIAAPQNPAPPRMGPCSPDRGPAFAFAECGTIRVFENRRAKRGRMIDVAFARWRAETPTPAGAVFLLAGGPGGSSASVAGAADGWARPLRSTMDIVAVDQRGTWYSHALHCARDTEIRPAAAFGHIFDRSWVKQCRAYLEAYADLRMYTTDLAADDLDDIRAALGYEAISVYGSSYGTRLAQVYMRHYPTRTKAVVLDGVLPFDRNVALANAVTSQQALDRVLERRPPLRAGFARLLERFRRGPLATSVTPPGGAPVAVTMSRGDFAYAVRGILYSPSLIDNLPDWIQRAARTGDVSMFAQRYWERALSFSRTFATGLHLSVQCPEDIAVGDTPAHANATAGTFIDRYVIDEYRDICALWPLAQVPADFWRPVAVSVPTLLVSGYFDPVTPPMFAEQVAKSLPMSQVVVSKTGAHGSVAGCPASAALFVLRTGTLTGMPNACR